MSENLSEFRTKAVDDFLKAVYQLQQQSGGNPVPTNDLAQKLKISAPSVTDMVKRLSGSEEDANGEASIPVLLEYEKYKGVRLSSLGQKIALEVIRHHRLLELYLVQKLGYSWDEVHEEAEQLEHHISEKLEARIAAALGNPVVDPHGDPIPALDGTLPTREIEEPLSDLPEHSIGIVSQIVDQSGEVLRHLSDLGLVPGVEVTLAQRSPLNDTVTVEVNGAAHTMSMQFAHKVKVTPHPD